METCLCQNVCYISLIMLLENRLVEGDNVCLLDPEIYGIPKRTKLHLAYNARTACDPLRSPCKIYATPRTLIAMTCLRSTQNLCDLLAKSIPRTLNAMTCKDHVLHKELIMFTELQRQPLTLATFEPGGARATCTHVRARDVARGAARVAEHARAINCAGVARAVRP